MTEVSFALITHRWDAPRRRYTPPAPEPERPTCTLCGLPDVELEPSRRISRHQHMTRPRQRCRASGLFPVDLADSSPVHGASCTA